jgi:hypothetical protein
MAKIIAKTFIFLALCLAHQGFAQTFDGGDGLESSPYLISTAEQLAGLAGLVNDEATNAAYAALSYKLTADIDLSAYANWTPIGNSSSYSFSGTFNGNGKKITGLKITDCDYYCGLFGYVSGGKIENLGIEGADVSGGSWVGIIAGSVGSNSTISGSYSTGMVSGNNYVGGVVGSVGSNSTISNSYSTGMVNGNNYVGGVAGSAFNNTISNCSALNLAIVRKSGTSTDLGRVGGSNISGAFSGNAAFAGMTVMGSIITSGTADNSNGLGKTAAELQTLSGFPEALTQPPWIYDTGKLPGLGAAVEMPWHLKPENADLANAMSIVYNTAYITTQTAAVNAEQARSRAQEIINALELGEGITATVSDAGASSFTAAIAGTEGTPQGTNGSYNFKVSLSKGSATVESNRITLVIVAPYNFFAGGEGTNASPFEISTAEQLAKLAELVNAYVTNAAYAALSYKLIADIDLSVYDNWTPIGTFVNYDNIYPFSGSFNGNGKKITGLKITGTGNYCGLFGYVSGGIIENLGIEGADVSGGLVGIVAGWLTNNSAISDSYSTGTVSGTNNVGGVAGYVDNSAISDSYSTGTVSGTQSVGGVAGRLTNNSTISGSYSTGAVSGEGYGVGGVAGWIESNSTISDSYSAGTVSGTRGFGGVGGVAGYVDNSAISDSYSTGTVSGEWFVGGVAGEVRDNSAISNSYSTGAVSGKGSDIVGGVAGSVENNSTISESYSAGYVSRGSGVAGRVENNSTISGSYSTGTVSEGSGVAGSLINSTISNSYSAGDVSGGSGVAGYVSNSTISGSYSTGTVSGEGGVGGVAGSLNENSAISNCYSTGAVSGEGNDVGGVAGSVSNSTISGSYSTGAVNGEWNVGGVAGRVENNSTISDSYSAGTVSGEGGVGGVGGVAGRVENNSAISGSYSVGTVNGTQGVGGVAGYLIDNSTISDSYSAGAVSGTFSVGGVAGMVGSNSAISGSYSTETVSGTNYVGGVAGDVGGSTISDSYSTGAVSGTSSVGGVAGADRGSSTISNSYSTGAVSGEGGVGGVAGSVSNSTISGSYSTGAVSGTNYVGGVAGHLSDNNVPGFLSSNSTISNSYSTGAVIGTFSVGGVAGRVENNSAISGSYSTGTVSGESGVGGVAGYVYDNTTISNSYSTGAVSGTSSVGGVVGSLNGNSTISSSYSTSAVSGEWYVGGVAGHVFNSTISNCSALNPAIVRTSGSTDTEFGRVAGSSLYTTLSSGNVAFAGMTVMGSIITYGTADDYNGLSKTAAELQTASGFPETFMQSPWVYEPGKLPGLGAPVEMPLHLKPNMVTITGTAKFGETLTANTSNLTTQSDIVLGTLSYQWLRNGANIDGATSATYTTIAADVGQSIRVLVTAENYVGGIISESVTINASEPAPIANSFSAPNVAIILNSGENLLIQGIAKPETIRIFNLKGNMLMNRIAMPNESISISHLPKGMYLVNVGGRTFKVVR